MADDRCPLCRVPWCDHDDDTCGGPESFEKIKKGKKEKDD